MRFTKLGFLDDIAYKKPAEAAFQTVMIPLSAFAGSNGLVPARLKVIRFRFDRNSEGVVLLSKIGFE